MSRLAYLSRVSWILLCLAGLFSLGACASEAPLPLPGRCESNVDCTEGQRCDATYCEDIYHPRAKIKNY